MILTNTLVKIFASVKGYNLTMLIQGQGHNWRSQFWDFTFISLRHVTFIPGVIFLKNIGEMFHS